MVISYNITYYIMDLQSKTPRKRVANFTADEKALLAQLIKRRPIVQSKLTDGKSVAKKQEAWALITQEFNSKSNVQKRETITLKRAWDNIKAYSRKAHATERRPGSGYARPPLPEHGDLTIVDEAASMVTCEIKNTFDSDSAILDEIHSSPELLDLLLENKNEPDTYLSSDNLDTAHNVDSDNSETGMSSPQIEVQSTGIGEKYLRRRSGSLVHTDHVGRPIEYIRREAVKRIKFLENKKKMEIQILEARLEVEQIKKKAALLEVERNEILLEKAKLELEEAKSNK